ncbi:MAG: hypothetical protein HYY50_05885 [Candidatus Kerfeldbacteria bacterium]|nr:hypothetical protein [Candidatus Kerfeldbacteria bacterium]
MGKHLLEILGHKVYCSSDREYYGLKHLKYELEDEEARQLFAQCEQQREVDFEDQDHRRFTLVDGEDGSFTVVSHDKPSGWF